MAIEENKSCLGALIECGADPNKPEGSDKLELAKTIQQCLITLCYVEDEQTGETILHIMSKANQASNVALLIKVGFLKNKYEEVLILVCLPAWLRCQRRLKRSKNCAIARV